MPEINHDSVKTSWTRFTDKYAFCFGRFKDDVGLPEWQHLVSKCDTEILLDAMEGMSETWKGEWGQPKGPQVKRAYYDLRDKRMTISDSDGFKCFKCDNSGALWIIYYHLRHNERPIAEGCLRKCDGINSCLINNTHRPDAEMIKRLRVSPVPCVCSKGYKYGTHAMKGQDVKHNKPDSDYWEWSWKGQMEACQWIDKQQGVLWVP